MEMLFHLSLHLQVIGAVLTSFGIGSQTTNTTTGGAQPNTQVIFFLKNKIENCLVSLLKSIIH